MAAVAPTQSEVIYPPSDGEPMAKTELHRNLMMDLIAMLCAHFANDPMVYVSGNMMMDYVDGNADYCVSPDVFVTRGIPRLPMRETYKIWVEGKAPDVVIEVTSKWTARVDQRQKFALYRDVLKIPEYFLFDPLEKTLAGASLNGYRLIEDAYRLIEPVNGRVTSEGLGLELEVSGTRLRLFDPGRGVYLPTPVKVREALELETSAREIAEDRLRAETAARAAAESEIERLKREIEALKAGMPPQP